MALPLENTDLEKEKRVPDGKFSFAGLGVGTWGGGRKNGEFITQKKPESTLLDDNSKKG
mgnify:CR=1 FL=1